MGFLLVLMSFVGGGSVDGVCSVLIDGQQESYTVQYDAGEMRYVLPDTAYVYDVTMRNGRKLHLVSAVEKQILGDSLVQYHQGREMVLLNPCDIKSEKLRKGKPKFLAWVEYNVETVKFVKGEAEYEVRPIPIYR